MNRPHTRTETETDPGSGTAPLRTRGLTALLACTSAVTAANVYVNQPLLADAADSLGVPPDVLGSVPTATQLGYAAGILLLVPAGDSHDRRRLILGLGTASVLALAACAASPTVWCLVVSSFVLGLLSPVPQLVTPFAVALAGRQGGAGAGRGTLVGTVQAGLLVGVLAARAYSGALAELFGWRAVYGCSAALTLLLMAVLRRALPRVPPAAGTPAYRATLTSLPKLFAADRLVRSITLSGALVGISFGAFWTALTFLLERAYGFGPTGIGLFGLVAAASALGSPYAGRLADRLGHRLSLGLLIGLVVGGWLLLAPGGDGLLWLIAGVVVLDVGVWGSQAVCQTALFTRDPAVHSRLNTLYFTLRFLGIAVGSLLGTLAWAGGGWAGVVALGTGAAVCGLLVAVVPSRAAER
ncbi:MFS transporter [Streptomyces sp. BE147]|uniref:MFS transporter n=1 Tax=Streptomyces sp. BE147 TaxID=3002524 RepID=UPI002E7A242B|nr:MFS transporter [Streptomyces sp. BE147]MEE1742809.1 MFS transporter [Streptomyces sp. BE147]